MSRPWIVLKFGGTSVATVERWSEIARQAAGQLRQRRVWIVASALSGTTDGLERALDEALQGAATTALDEVRDAHGRLADDLALAPEVRAAALQSLDDAERWLEGVRLTGEAGPRLRARLLATGELASTRLGVEALRAHGIEARWVDARRLLVARPQPGEAEHDRYLEARVAPTADAARAEDEAAGSDVVLTQGFIARAGENETCLLGRGGSDTSAALFAVLLGAAELEIWTDVPGLFTADPRVTPSARLIRRIGYREAQELAALGAKVLHPRCLRPVAGAGVPVRIRSAVEPEIEGTRIGGEVEPDAAVTAVTQRRGVTLITVSTWSMWETPGFLARTFAPFAELGVSIDLVGTSQSAVSVTLDHLPGGADGSTFRELVERLQQLGRVEVRRPCAVVSIVGRRIRSVLHELGPALASLQEHPVHLVSDSSEDLNLSFVVDEQDGPALVARLHARLFPAQGGDPRFGDTWEKLHGASSPRPGPVRTWWSERREELIAAVRDGLARYVYWLPQVREQAARLRRLAPVDRIYYAMKANSHPAVLATVVGEGLGLECVSIQEVRRAREVAGEDVALLFTPNFCAPAEYEEALALGAELTFDSASALEAIAPALRGREIALRIDPGQGLGHHPKVRTAGAHTKFGLPPEEAIALRETVARLGVRVCGLHAHVGSGIFDAEAWLRTGRVLARLLDTFGDVRWLDLGGGLGIPQHPGEAPLDLEAVERALAELRDALPGLELRLEPGRFLVSGAGVLLAPVTQVRRKGGVNFAGVATGMNSLLRPALYGAWHAIHNLSRLDQPAVDYYHVVGPICETTDVLGHDRWLPPVEPGDVLLIENAGAYGAVMGSSYNLRGPAAEVVLDSSG